MSNPTDLRSSIKKVNRIRNLLGAYYLGFVFAIEFTLGMLSPTYTAGEIPSFAGNTQVLYAFLDFIFIWPALITISFIVVLWRNKSDVLVQALKIKRLRQIPYYWVSIFIIFLATYALLVVTETTKIPTADASLLAYMVFFVLLLLFTFVALFISTFVMYFFSPGINHRWRAFKFYWRRERLAFDYAVFSFLKQRDTFKMSIGRYYAFLFMEAFDVMSHILRRGLPRLDVTRLGDSLSVAMIAIKSNVESESQAATDFFAALENLHETASMDTGLESTQLVQEMSRFRNKTPEANKIREDNGIKGIWESKVIYIIKNNILIITFVLIAVSLVVTLIGLLLPFA